MKIDEKDVLIAIPSKGRVNGRTQKLLDAQQESVEYFMFLEPQEIEFYEAQNKVSIEKSGGGICYVRNFILDYAKQRKYKYLVMVDDDVTGVGRVFNARNVKTEFLFVVRHLMRSMIKYKKGQGSPQYGQYAWSSKPLTFNCFCGVFTIIDIEALGEIRYDYAVPLKEDIDFSLQQIIYGSGTIRNNEYWFTCPSIGTNKGGLFEEYRKGSNEQSALKMKEKWGDDIKLVDKKGVMDVQINKR